VSYGLTHSFAEELFLGLHDFGVDTFRIALYTTELDQSQMTYTATGEITGGTYPAGGVAAVMILDAVAGASSVSIEEKVIQIPGAVVSALVYNASKANRTVLVAPVIGANGAGTLTLRWDQPIINLVV
jgi:hypothetical protein